MRTRNGIYYDLHKSTYKFKTPDTNITFVFSSDLHMLKFEDQYEENRKVFNTKMQARFRINTCMKVMPDILIYKKIETRGFLLIDEGGHKICLENLQLIGEKATHNV